MLRAESGGRRFSLSRILLNMVPNFANDSTPAITKKAFDTLFDFQWALTNYKTLTYISLYISGIVPNEALAKKVHKVLTKMGILYEGEPYIDTIPIDKNFTHRLSILPAHAQKKLVCLLFDWQEELIRWKVLEDEEAEIKVVLEEERIARGEEARVGHLEKRLMEIKGLKSLKPSFRLPSGGTVNHQEQPPSYG